MILDYLDEKETPHLTRQDRLIILIYLLGITNKRQIQTITNWTPTQIKDTIYRIRYNEKKAAEKGDWLISWKVNPTQQLYRLGQKGIEHAIALRDERIGRGQKKKRPHQAGHWAHFLGLNDILCRLIQSNINFQEFLTGKEVLSYLYREHRNLAFNKWDKLEAELTNLPFRPDGMVTIEDQSYFLEYDTGSETTTRLTTKLENYVTGATNANKPIFPVVWVCRTERRKGVIERVAARYREKVEENGLHGIKFPAMYCFVEGQEVEFFAGNRTASPFWEEEK